MNDFFNKLADKFVDIMYLIGEKLDFVSDKIFEQTHIKLNLKIILGVVFGFIFLVIFIKAILSFLWSQL